ncbi:MAG TPA: 4-hydroxyphenylpyruvate dioxygenase [Cyanobacteria bacterium UBA11049]|nr:4-hydroxyphenylpyruvate dioxygenase [Cyanobacteria bacterium UBA11049]
MKIDRVHFYVEDARAWRNWFVHKLGFQAVASGSSISHTCTEVVKSGEVYFALSSPLTPLSPVANFLRQHPPGVADVAFCIEDIEAVMQGAIAWGAQVIQPIQHQQGYKWAKIAAWGSLTHTLIERQEVRGKRHKAGGKRQEAKLVHPTLREGQSPTSLPSPRIDRPNSPSRFTFAGIDHIVLNVAAGDLERAVAWYENVLGFHAQQAFKIQTDRSALHSRVLVSSNKCVQFPINQPASPNSQIQEFLDFNRGAGIQHIALQIPNIVQAIASFRSSGVSFLSVPPTYYTQLQERLGLPLSVAELQEIAQQQILVDWQENNPHALLLQTFTQPIFTQPTFFFEIIERRSQALGFGEGNFRALFEAIEREQIKRGSLFSS